MSRLRFVSILVFVAFLGFAACSDDSSDPTGPGVDETAPLVFSTEPEPDDSGVPVSEDLVVLFNEAMDPASATGNVSLSTGSITDLSWDDARTLRIEHSAWTAGARVEVTLGTGLTDAAGNGLAAPHGWGFWVATPDVVLLETDPANGATGIPLNTRVVLRFNRRMNLTTLAAATVVDDGIVGRAPVGFSYSEGPDEQVLMTFAEELPALATITVTIGTGATAEGGQPLSAETSFSFRTGNESDTTPPALISVVPASGSTINPSTATIVFTFSEAIDETRFEPDMLGAQFLFLLESASSDVVFSEGGTVLTVALPTPLPAGLPIYVYFEQFYDLAGNASTSALEYRVDVSGTAEVWPWVDGFVGIWWAVEETKEGMDPPYTDEFFYAKRIEDQGSGTIHYSSYYDAPPAPPDDWEIFQRDGNSIDFLGFGELEEGTPFEVLFDDPLQWLALPPTAGASWDGSTTFPFDEVIADLDFSGEIVAIEDLIIDFDLGGPPTMWVDCWKLRIEYQISYDGSTLISGEEFLWYAPTVGPVREMTHEEDLSEDRVSDWDEWLIGFDDEEF